MSHTPFEELVRRTEGELTSRRAAELEQQLESDAALRDAQAGVERLIDGLRREDPALDGVDLREGLWTRPAPPRAGRRQLAAVLAASGVALAAGVAVLFAAPPRPTAPAEEPEARVKGGAPELAGFEAFVLRDGRGQALGPTMRAGDALGFSYRNLPGSPYRALMLYATDERGTTYWFYPAWTEASEAPRSIPIGLASGAVELPDAVRHPLVPGKLVVHALFSVSPLGVREVEQGGPLPDGVLTLSREVQVLP